MVAPVVVAVAAVDAGPALVQQLVVVVVVLAVVLVLPALVPVVVEMPGYLGYSC